MKATKESPAPPDGKPVRAQIRTKCRGRGRLIRQVASSLLGSRCRGCVLWGAPGIGKSTVAAAALEEPRIKEQFGRRRYSVPCEEVGSAQQLWAAIAKVLGMPAGAQATVWVKEVLKGSTTLLLLDDLTRLAPTEIGRLLTQDLLVPGLTLIGTCHSPTFLRPDGMPAIQVDKLTPAAAAKLFHDRTDRNFVRDPNLTKILEAMDGMPLAIVLMAARAAAQKNLLGLWTDWQQSRTSMLAIAGSQDSKNNLNVCIRLSLTNLQGEGRPLLQILSLLPDGLRRSGLPALYVEEAEANRLLDQALISAEGERILMLAPLREYVLADPRLKPCGENFRALMYLSQLVKDFGPKIGEPGGRDSIARLTEELRNLESLIRGSLVNPSLAGLASEAARGLAPFLRFSGLGDFQLLEEAASPTTTPLERGMCLLACADVALERALYGKAEDYYQRAEEEFSACGDDKLRVMCLIGRGHSNRYRCQHRAARAFYAKARRFCRFQLHDYRRGLAHVHKGLGHLLLARDSPARARLHYQKAERLFSEEGLRVEAANCQRSLGLIMCRQRNYQTATALLTAAMQTLREAGDQRGVADCLQFLANVELDQETAELSQAEHYAQEANAGYNRLQDARGQAQCKSLQARLQIKHGKKSDAIRLYREALALFAQKDARRSMADVYAALASLCESPDDRRRAREEANQLYNALELPRLIIQA